MHLNKFQKRAFSWLVLCSFIMLLHGSTAPLRGENSAGNENVSAAAAPGSGDELEPGMVEKIGDSGKTAGKKKFPWLLVAAGAVVVVGAVVYFTLIYKPKYALTIALGEGVTGTPAAGTVEYKKGTVVNYNFTAAAGYKKLAVTLDGASVNASGTVTMDKAHTLSATSIEGIDEQFTSSASSLWKPWHPSSWWVASGYYKCSAVAPNFSWEYNILDYRFQKNQFVAEIRFRMTGGIPGISNGIGLVTSSNMTNTSGYFFYISGDTNPDYAIYRYTNQNFQTVLPPSDLTIKNWTANTYINEGLNAWNTLRVTRNGSAYTLLINGISGCTVADNLHDVRYIVFVGGVVSTDFAWDIDYVTVSMGMTPTSGPVFPAMIDSVVSLDPMETMTGRRKQE